MNPPSRRDRGRQPAGAAAGERGHCAGRTQTLVGPGLLLPDSGRHLSYCWPAQGSSGRPEKALEFYVECFAYINVLCVCVCVCVCMCRGGCL